MKYGFSQKLFGYFYHSSCMKQAKRQHLQIDSKAIKQEYRAILTRAKDIGKSRLMSSYCMGAYFFEGAEYFDSVTIDPKVREKSV